MLCCTTCSKAEWGLLTMVQGDFFFNNVGQGLFYSGKISNRNQSFYVVYDCGMGHKPAKKLLNSTLRAAFPHKDTHLNMLVISHFDSDHVDGLSELMKRISRIDLVVMPYMTIEERVLLACKEESPTRDYRQFLLNPMQFFEQIDVEVERYVFLTHTEDNGEENNDFPPRMPDFPTEEWFSKYEDKKSKQELMDEYSLTDEPNKFHVCFDKWKQYVLGAWIFEFYVRQVDWSKLMNFRGAIQVVLKNRQLHDAKEIFSYPKAIAEIRSAYDECINSVRNNTSVVMLHYPYHPKPKEYSLYTRIFNKKMGMDYGWPFYPRRSNVYLNDREDTFATLLLGDIDLHSDWLEIRRRFRNRLRYICCALVPHHGAITSWDESVLDEIGDGNALWVVSHGIDSQYGHPNNEVIASFAKNCRYLLSSNEDQKVVVRIVSV